MQENAFQRDAFPPDPPGRFSRLRRSAPLTWNIFLRPWVLQKATSQMVPWLFIDHHTTVVCLVMKDVVSAQLIMIFRVVNKIRAILILVNGLEEQVAMPMFPHRRRVKWSLNYSKKLSTRNWYSLLVGPRPVEWKIVWQGMTFTIRQACQVDLKGWFSFEKLHFLKIIITKSWDLTSNGNK